MNRRIFALIALVLAVGALARPAVANVQAVSVSSVHSVLSGRILNESGDPLASALVSVVIHGSSETVLTARTGEDGAYKISIPALPGAYSFRVLHIGYAPYNLGMSKQAAGWNVPAEVVMHPIAMEESLPF